MDITLKKSISFSYPERSGGQKSPLSQRATQADEPQPGIALDIVIVDDDPRDSQLTLDLLQEGNILNYPTVFNDPEKALQYLLVSHDLKRGLPDLILLDYSMPKISGVEFLKEIRENTSTHALPVFILTNSTDDGIILQSYKYKAQGYLQKPIDHSAFMELVMGIQGFGVLLGKRPSATPF